MILLNGKELSNKLKLELQEKVKKLKRQPGLGIILVGDRPDSAIYVRMKKRACDKVGIKNFDVQLRDTITQKALIEEIEKMNNNNDINAILVQLPLPKHINEREVLSKVNIKKDVDGFHSINVGNLTLNHNLNAPCTPLGCYLLIKKIEPNLSGKKAVMVGRSNLNGKPMTQLLLKENCTVTITHSRTKDLKAECLEADIIVAAVGIPELVKGDWVKKDTIVIDVGINKTDKGIVGDVDFDEVSKNAKALTPVPGGVGPMTIACLLKNTIDCFKRSQI